jgi:hypothetical protein
MADLNLITSRIEVNGKFYKLQHPGNREWLRIKKTMLNVSSDSIDMEPLLDYFFEHCCFPEEGSKLTVDNVSLEELEEVWGLVAPRFLRGALETGYVYPDQKRGKSKTSQA